MLSNAASQLKQELDLKCSEVAPTAESPGTGKLEEYTLKPLRTESLTSIFVNLVEKDRKKILNQEKQIFLNLKIGREYLNKDDYKKAYPVLSAAYNTLTQIRALKTDNEYMQAADYFYDLYLVEFILGIDSKKLFELEALIKKKLLIFKKRPSTIASDFSLALFDTASEFYGKKEFKFFKEFHSIYFRLAVAIINNIFDAFSKVGLDSLLGLQLKYFSALKKNVEERISFYTGIEKLCRKLGLKMLASKNFPMSSIFFEEAGHAIKYLNISLKDSRYKELLVHTRAVSSKLAAIHIANQEWLHSIRCFKKIIEINEQLEKENGIYVNPTDEFKLANLITDISLANSYYKLDQLKECFEIIDRKEKQFSAKRHQYPQQYIYILSAAADLKSSQLAANCKKDLNIALQYGVQGLTYLLQAKEVFAFIKNDLKLAEDIAGIQDKICGALAVVATDVAMSRNFNLMMGILKLSSVFKTKKTDPEFHLVYPKLISFCLTYAKLDFSVTSSEMKAKLTQIRLDLSKVNHASDKKLIEANLFLEKYNGKLQAQIFAEFKTKLNSGAFAYSTIENFSIGSQEAVRETEKLKDEKSTSLNTRKYDPDGIFSQESLATIYPYLTVKQAIEIGLKDEEFKQKMALARKKYFNKKFDESYQIFISVFDSLNQIKPIETVDEQLAAIWFFYDLYLLEFILKKGTDKLKNALTLLQETTQTKESNPVHYVAKIFYKQAIVFQHFQPISFIECHLIFMRILRMLIENVGDQASQMSYALELYDSMLAFHVKDMRFLNEDDRAFYSNIFFLVCDLAEYCLVIKDYISCARLCDEARDLLENSALYLGDSQEILQIARSAYFGLAAQHMAEKNYSAAIVNCQKTISLDEKLNEIEDKRLADDFVAKCIDVHSLYATALINNNQVEEALKMLALTRAKVLPLVNNPVSSYQTLFNGELKLRGIQIIKEKAAGNLAAAIEHGIVLLELLLKIPYAFESAEAAKHSVSSLFYETALELAKNKEFLLIQEMLQVAVAFSDLKNEKAFLDNLKTVTITLFLCALKDYKVTDSEVEKYINSVKKIKSIRDNKFDHVRKWYDIGSSFQREQSGALKRFKVLFDARDKLTKLTIDAKPVMLGRFKDKSMDRKAASDLIEMATVLKTADLDLKLASTSPVPAIIEQPKKPTIIKSKSWKREKPKAVSSLPQQVVEDDEIAQESKKQALKQSISQLEEMVASYIHQVSNNKRAVVINGASKYAKTYNDKHLTKTEKDLKSISEQYSVADSLFRLKKIEAAVMTAEATQIEKNNAEISALEVSQVTIREHIEKLAKMNEVLTETLMLIESEVVVKDFSDKVKFKKKPDDKKLTKDEKKAKKREEQLEHKKQRQLQPKPVFIKAAVDIDTKTPVTKSKSMFFNSVSNESVRQKNSLNKVFFHLIKLKVSMVDFEDLIKNNSDNNLFQEMRHYVLLLHITRIMQELKSYAEIQTATGQANEDESLNLRNMIMHAPCIAEPAEVLATATSITENLPQHLLTFRKEYSTDLVLDEKKQRELISLYKMTDDADRYFASPFPLVIKSTLLYKKLASYHEQKMSTKFPEHFAEQQIYGVLFPKIISVAAIIDKGWSAPVTAEDPKKEMRRSFYAHHLDMLKMLLAICGELSRHLKTSYKLPQAILFKVQKIRNEVGHSYSISPDEILECGLAISRNQAISCANQRYALWRAIVATPATAVASIAKLNP